jgi:hypothetical protein
MPSSKLIPVPKTPKESFNPDRQASALLLSQILHLREALTRHLTETAAILAIDLRTLKTEREVSDYIRKATIILHPHPAGGIRK